MVNLLNSFYGLLCIFLFLGRISKSKAFSNEYSKTDLKTYDETVKVPSSCECQAHCIFNVKLKRCTAYSVVEETDGYLCKISHSSPDDIVVTESEKAYTRSDIPGLGECNAKPCFKGVSCNGMGKYPYFSCGKCPKGYTGNGTVCKDINECEREDNGGCVQHSKCINLEGSVKCGGCDAGFKGSQTEGCRPDAKTCKYAKDCNVHSKCELLLGYGYKVCKCRLGYAGDGDKCGIDKDADGYPEIKQDCPNPKCKEDNCPAVPNSGQEDMDGDGDGDACDADLDGDSVPNERDNCQFVSNKNQQDKDNDKSGDLCDNCKNDYNSNQEDNDMDGIGDLCDPDDDNDGLPDDEDNCPMMINLGQEDSDQDGVGDICDNCPDDYNPGQADKDQDLVGDKCDLDEDSDQDGTQDNLDNCNSTANAGQVDTDGDGIGDDCDDDIDDDGILNDKDNCPLIANGNQTNVCEFNQDGDARFDYEDVCPNNFGIYRTNFKKFQKLVLGRHKTGKASADPVWEIYNQGAEIVQSVNSLPVMAIGYDKFQGVDFDGTFFVSKDFDDDYLGFVFSYQSNKKFYVAMWKAELDREYDNKRLTKDTALVAKQGFQLKLIDSETGPSMELQFSLWQTESTPNQATLLWIDPKATPWAPFVSYRWHLRHRPSIGLIHIQIYDQERLVIDTGNITNTALKGGRLGVFCYSQPNMRFSDLVTKCVEEEVASTTTQKRSTTASTTTASTTTASTTTASTCPTTKKCAKGSYYYCLGCIWVTKDYGTWVSSRKECKRHGADLATLDNFTTNAEVVALFEHVHGIEDQIWVGGIKSGDHYKWLTGKKIPNHSPLYGKTEPNLNIPYFAGIDTSIVIFEGGFRDMESSALRNGLCLVPW